MTAPRSSLPNSLVVLAAGGTGGHLFPAEALARALIRRGRPVALVTDKRGKAFPVDGVDTYRVRAGRLGGGLLAKARFAVDLGRGILEARRLLRRLAPGTVVGFGGYPSMPTMVAATSLKLPTLIHDQNAVLGRANKMLATRVGAIATSFDTVAGVPATDAAKIERTGNPVRPAVVAVRDLPYEAPGADGPIRLLIIGGSQGARILSRVVPDALKALPTDLKARLVVSQQVRPEDLEAVEAAYRGSGLAVETRRFFDDIPARLAAAQLVLARAGGSTTAELTVAGRPALLVPFAGAIADEQTANARVLVEHGAAWLLSEAEFTAERVSTLLAKLLNDGPALARAAEAARALGEPAAAERLADLVERLTKGDRP
ncbi:UDP-N-acetylglucosamine--N-acetylmuramyl-(pentapeptide) pyrophosphoryl-undecaprenol N-acetylglucosamine transferase [Aliidongia dinghuensis]|uniref:UDP-N-acetylglucosamine--N-acetylmuramyl-(pentapeptide) pyrophosphoryl-undecaprenol N-acetylglucosamine transferase n=1 Tax=Aliidongia dinghuensis TaxID=1867774 RepID=A0A8J3E3C5_9PROT|nr:undecaprenyldiphospho-muramoylpentapeptide beta-N-acetylglucosaminyltransferase [Aliidongia dinghuensis]GGF17446.1 UDP-N-acetylglucosamine--N-acetylmuramyl-(pentapeptide) pyrophosphoryl-undecaprenol N-acetylglucosamine transferase [Aliidongia dinghuensis]